MGDVRDDQCSYDDMLSTFTHALADYAESLPSGTELCIRELLEKAAENDAGVARMLALCSRGLDEDEMLAPMLSVLGDILFDLVGSVPELLEKRGIYPDSLESTYKMLGLPYYITFRLRRRIGSEEMAAIDEPPAMEGCRLYQCSFLTGTDDFIAVKNDDRLSFTRFRSHASDSEQLTFGDLTPDQWSGLEHTLRDLDVYGWHPEIHPDVLDAPSWTFVVTFEGGRYFKLEGDIEDPPNPNHERLIGAIRALATERE